MWSWLCKKKNIVGEKANSATKLPSWSSGAVCVTRLPQHNIFLYPAVSFLEEAALDRLIKAPCLEDARSERLWGSFIIFKGVGFELCWKQHEVFTREMLKPHSPTGLKVMLGYAAHVVRI